MERQLPIGLLLSWDTLEAIPTQKAPSIQGSTSYTPVDHCAQASPTACFLWLTGQPVCRPSQSGASPSLLDTDAQVGPYRHIFPHHLCHIMEIDGQRLLPMSRFLTPKIGNRRRSNKKNDTCTSHLLTPHWPGQGRHGAWHGRLLGHLRTAD